MNKEGLSDLLRVMREHPSFADLLKAVEEPTVHVFRPSDAENVAEAQANWIFRSGRQKQDEMWRTALTKLDPMQMGNSPSRQEKS